MSINRRYYRYSDEYELLVMEKILNTNAIEQQNNILVGNNYALSSERADLYRKHTSESISNINRIIHDFHLKDNSNDYTNSLMILNYQNQRKRTYR